MKSIQSPLRYPGSKCDLVEYFAGFLKENLLVGAHLYEPYAGGASISLSMLERSLVRRATLIERDPLIYAFWKCVKSQPDALCRRIARLPITLKTWKRFRKYRASDALKKYELLDMGVAGLFFNRCNFSGIIAAGPVGGMTQTSAYKINCRFNKKTLTGSIRQIAPLLEKASIVYGDALQYLSGNHERISHESSLVYIDPPYLQQGERLYRYYYQEKDHRRLAMEINKATYPWLVSYDNHPLIYELFSTQRITPIFLNYAVKKSRKAMELLISNRKLIEPVYKDEKGKQYEISTTSGKLVSA